MDEDEQQSALKLEKKLKKRRKSEEGGVVEINGNNESGAEEKIKKKKKKTDSDGNAIGGSSAVDDEPVIGRKRTRSMSEAEVMNPSQSTESFREEHQVTFSGMEDDGKTKYVCPNPMLKFSDTPFAAPILKCFEAAGFAGPTPTQAQAWPVALSGRDVIVVAKTGSGKTCGFLLPAFHRLLNSQVQRKRGPPAILVLAPTRELACQIEEECVKFGRTSFMRSTCCYGGSPKSMQIRKLQQGVEVLIATPGRLNDLLEMGCVDLSDISFLVLDEADRMLDMGFEPQIRTIISSIPTRRQSMMFTATWPREVQTLAREFLQNPVEIRFGDIHSLNANKSITQNIRVIQESQKKESLLEVLKEINPSGEVEKVPKTIIFVSRKASCDHLANDLWNSGYYADSIHGDREQSMRTKVMDNFKKGAVQVLVATDVAARGLDVKDIEVVINYDFPAGNSGVEDYVHRIGRTARGVNAKGLAYTFFTAGDSKRASQLIGVLKRAGQVVPDELKRFDGGGRFSGGGGSWGGGRGGGGGGFRGGFGGRGGGGGRMQSRKW